jgi:hypothetical protein
MSVYPAPANQQGEIFNPSLWIVSAITGVSVQYLDENYLRYPVAQGYETLNGMTNLSNGTFEKNIVMTGTYLTNYIEFPDGSQQFTADSGGGSGDAQLSAGTSTTPQTFTGYNEFSNADGQITLTNTTTPTSVIIASDTTNNNQLNIGGDIFLDTSYKLTTNSIFFPQNPSSGATNQTSLTQNNSGLTINNELTFISYSTPANSITMYADAATNNQLDVIGTLATSTIKSATVNINNVDTSVLLTCTGTTTSTLNVGSNLSTTGDIYLNGLHLAKDGNTNGLNIISAGLTIGNTTNGYYSILSSDATTNQLLNITGDVAISTVQTYGTTYPDQNLATIKYVNGVSSGSLLGTNNTWTGTNAFNTSTPTTTITQTYPQATSTTQFATIGYVNTGISDATQYAALLNYGTSVSPQTFTGYNQINLLSFNGQSCAQKILNSSNSYATGSGSQWIWYNNIPYTLGNGFAFAFSTNNTPTAYTVSSNENLTPQANCVISGTGYAVYQPYVLSGTTYDAYIFNITGYCGTANLTAYTTANAQGTGKPQITIQTNDNNSFYLNIKMSLYIYPQAIV